MSKNSKFWLGIGVIMIAGKEYGAEMPLPVDKLDPADLKKMEKDGRIGEKVAPVEVECQECASHKNTIKARDILIAELNSEVERLKDAAKSASEAKAAHVKDHSEKKTSNKDGKK